MKINECFDNNWWRCHHNKIVTNNQLYRKKLISFLVFHNFSQSKVEISYIYPILVSHLRLPSPNQNSHKISSYYTSLKRKWVVFAFIYYIIVGWISLKSFFWHWLSRDHSKCAKKSSINNVTVLGEGSVILWRQYKGLSIKMVDGGRRGVNIFPKLRDVIYGQPLQSILNWKKYTVSDPLSNKSYNFWHHQRLHPFEMTVSKYGIFF